ncbi:hypothetical protein KIPB_016805, partial [Kipferlia bialata]|eukprot:g16805.t1
MGVKKNIHATGLEPATP